MSVVHDMQASLKPMKFAFRWHWIYLNRQSELEVNGNSLKRVESINLKNGPKVGKSAVAREKYFKAS